MSRLEEIVQNIIVLEKSLIKQDIEKSKSDYKLKLERLEARRTDKQYTKEESEYVDNWTDQETQCEFCEYWRKDSCIKVRGEISSEGHCKFWERPEIEKAMKGGEPVGTIKKRTDGQTYKKVAQTGDANKDWKLVTKDKTGNKEDIKDGVSNGEQGNSQVSKKDLVEHAKNTSEEALNNAIKQSTDSKIRQSAHEELDRRSKEEHIQEDKKETKVDKKEEGNEHVEEFRQLSDEQIKFYLDAPYPKVKEAAKQIANERGLSIVSKEDYIKQFEDFSEKGDYTISKFYRNQSEKSRKYLDQNKEIRSSTSFYKGNGFKDIREFITFGEVKRQGETKESIQKDIDNLSKFIDDNKIDKDLCLYRNVMIGGTFFTKLKEGDIYEDKSFSSTALTPQDIFGDFEIKILAKKDSKVSNLDNDKEQEYLVDKDSKFRVIEKKDNGIIVELL